MKGRLVTEADMPALAVEVAQLVRSTGARVVALSGEVGSGKTTFTRNLMVTMGYDGLDVSSPTFSLVHHYNIKGFGLVCHYDLHRVGSRAELEEIMFFDAVNDVSLVVVEWPELVLDYLSGELIKIDFHYSGNTFYNSEDACNPVASRLVDLQVIGASSS